MIRLHRFFASLLVAAGISTTAWSAVGPIPFTAAQIKTINWQYAPSITRLAKDWENWSGPQIYPGYRVLKRKSIKIGGSDFTTELRLATASGSYEILIRPLADPASSTVIRSFGAEVHKVFGKADKAIDLSYTKGEVSEVLDLESDWIVGSTRVRLSYFGFGAMKK